MKRISRLIMVFIFTLLSMPVWAGATSSNDPHANSPSDSSDGCGCGGSKGMPVYSFKSMLAGLSLRDTPLNYTPPVGPEMDFTLTYNARESDQPDIFDAFNVGKKWTLNWRTYIQDDPASPGVGVKRYVAGGGAELYSGYQASTGAFDPEENNAAVLVRTSDSPITYELRFADGGKDVFAQADGKNAYPRKVFLTQKVDAQGNAVTLGYDSRMRLSSVTDAIGQSATFQYDNADYPLALTGISGPFGRGAHLAYDDQGRLTSVTDAIGMTSTFTYADDTFINSMTTPYGTTTFSQTKGVGGNTERSVQATDPMGYTERTEYRHNAPGIAFSTSPTPSGMTVRNAYINYRNSFYWDKSMFAMACSKDGDTANCDYTKARIKHFLHNSNARSQTARTLESIKYPLERRIWYRYPGQSSALYSGSLDKPTRVGRVLDDGDTQLTAYQYNEQGNVTRRTGPNGRETDYTYAPDGIDLIRVERRTASGFDALATYTYNGQHQPLTVTDVAGETTTYTYNTRGQRSSTTDPLGNTVRYTYDANGYLTTVTNALGHTARSFTYDAKGRIASDTDSQGYTRQYRYDALNRITKIQYPDGTARTFTWDRLDLASITDRAGRTTTFVHDANRKLIRRTDALGQTTRYSYYANGRLKTLTDGNGNVTTWARDLEGRVTAKTYTDGNGTTFTYDATNRLARKTDALGQAKNYTYTVADLLASVDYNNAVNPTPSVQFAYDPYYQRVRTMTDGHGVTQYGYYPAGVLGAGQLKGEQGDNSHDSLRYDYDALGRPISRTVDGSTERFVYDALGRVVGDQNTLGHFTNAYLGDTGQLTREKVTDTPYQVAYQYQDNLNDRRLKAILNDAVQNGGTQPVMDYGFTTSPDGLIQSRTETDASDDQSGSHHDHGHYWGWPWNHHWSRFGWGTDRSRHGGLLGGLLGFLFGGFGHGHHPGHHSGGGDQGGHQTTTTYGYDDALRLTSVDNQNRVDYGYDAADNLVQINQEQDSTPISVNSLNQIQARGADSYRYDANGNLTEDGMRTYTWDAADRLLTVTDKTTSHVSAFAYDGLSRRISDTETDTGGTPIVTHNLWCGLRLCEQRAGDDTVTARYFSQGEVQNGTVYYYAKDQVGSVVALVDTDGQVAGRATYDAYGNITDQSGVQPGYAYAGLYYHKDSALYLATYRAYGSLMGRWLSRDPIGESGGINQYAYVSDNPVLYLDTYGLLSPVAASAIGGAVGGGASGLINGTIEGGIVGAAAAGVGIVPGAIAGGVTGLLAGAISGGITGAASQTSPAVGVVAGFAFGGSKGAIGEVASGLVGGLPSPSGQLAGGAAGGAMGGYLASPETPWAPASGLLGGVIGGAMTAALCEGNDECRAALHPEKGDDNERSCAQ